MIGSIAVAGASTIGHAKHVAADTIEMRPRFGSVTKVIAVVFLLSGVGAAYPAMSDSDGSNRIVLGILAVVFTVIGAGLWLERPWAWWAGLSVTAFTVVMSQVLKAPERGGWVWPVVLLIWVAFAVQGWRSRSDA